jgi:hypothetical protein
VRRTHRRCSLVCVCVACVRVVVALCDVYGAAL